MITQNSLIGSATKSLANSTSSRWFKKNVWKTKPSGQRKTSSLSQVTNNNFFKSSQLFVSEFLQVLKHGYKNEILNMPLYSWLIGYMMQIAPDDLKTHSSIIPQKCRISKGYGTTPEDVLVYNKSSYPFTIAWTSPGMPGPGIKSYTLSLAWMQEKGAYFKYIKEIPCNPLIPHYNVEATTEKAGDILFVWYFFTDLATGENSMINEALIVEVEK